LNILLYLLVCGYELNWNKGHETGNGSCRYTLLSVDDKPNKWECNVVFNFSAAAYEEFKNVALNFPHQTHQSEMGNILINFVYYKPLREIK
jgi:hypothetical protein